ncbi:hypothetical protein [Flavilitoribacter nigricans]|nr:hypothetical protein [Flavilitoribacter nigricans]
MEIVWLIIIGSILTAFFNRREDPIEQLPEKKFDKVTWKEYRYGGPPKE